MLTLCAIGSIVVEFASETMAVETVPGFGLLAPSFGAGGENKTADCFADVSCNEFGK